MTTGGIRFTPTRTGWNLRDFPGKGAPIRAKARRCVWADREMTVKTHTARSPFSVASIGIAVIVLPCFAQEDQRTHYTHLVHSKTMSGRR
jgi:hypothetical protein